MGSDDSNRPGDDERTVWIPPKRPGPPPQQWYPPQPGPPQYPQQPGGWYQPQPQPGRGGMWKWIALTVVAVVVLVAAIIVIVKSTGGDGNSPGPTAAGTTSAVTTPGPATSAPGEPSATSSAAPGTIGADGLAALLLTPGELQEVVKAPVTAAGDGSTPIEQTTDRPDCGGVMLMPSTAGLDGANFTAVRTQLLRHADDPSRMRIQQWAIAFPDGPAAAAYLANESQRWSLCNMKTVSLTEGGTTSQWTVSVAMFSPSGAQLANLAHQQGAGDWWCNQQGMARGNVVVGASVCTVGTANLGGPVASQMAQKVPR